METKKKITVIGAGNGGMAMAYSLGQMGHDVCIYDSPDFPAQIWQFPSKGMSRTRTATWRLAILPERIQSSVRWGICMSLH